jgi:hypothetical protein
MYDYFINHFVAWLIMMSLRLKIRCLLSTEYERKFPEKLNPESKPRNPNCGEAGKNVIFTFKSK